MDKCPVCSEPIEVCPYGGDCGEINYIARQRQKEINADIEIDPDRCCLCDAELSLSEKVVNVCDECQLEARLAYEDQLDREEFLIQPKGGDDGRG